MPTQSNLLNIFLRRVAICFWACLSVLDVHLFTFHIYTWSTNKKERDTKAWDRTNTFCPVLSSLPWMQHPHLWLSPDTQETHLFFVCLTANMLLVGTSKWRLKCHLYRCFLLHSKRFEPILCKYDRAEISTARVPLDTTPNFIHLHFSFSFVLASPPPSSTSVVSWKHHALLATAPRGLPETRPPHLLCDGRVGEQVLRVLQLLEICALRWRVTGSVRHVRFCAWLQMIVKRTERGRAEKQSTEGRREREEEEEQRFCHVTYRTPDWSQRAGGNKDVSLNPFFIE